MITLDRNICKLCWQENKWEIKIKERLIKEFDEKIYNEMNNGYLSSKHPIVILYKELRKIYETTCLTIEFDCNDTSICRKHLEQFLKEMQ